MTDPACPRCLGTGRLTTTTGNRVRCWRCHNDHMSRTAIGTCQQREDRTCGICGKTRFASDKQVDGEGRTAQVTVARYHLCCYREDRALLARDKHDRIEGRGNGPLASALDGAPQTTRSDRRSHKARPAHELKRWRMVQNKGPAAKDKAGAMT